MGLGVKDTLKVLVIFLWPEVVAHDVICLTTGGGCSASASVEVEPKRGVANHLDGFSGVAPITRWSLQILHFDTIIVSLRRRLSVLISQDAVETLRLTLLARYVGWKLFNVFVCFTLVYVSEEKTPVKLWSNRVFSILVMKSIRTELGTSGPT